MLSGELGSETQKSEVQGFILKQSGNIMTIFMQ